MTKNRLFGVISPRSKKSRQQTITLNLVISAANDLELIRVYEGRNEYIALYALSSARVDVHQTYPAKVSCEVFHSKNSFNPVRHYVLCEDQELLHAQQTLGSGNATLVASINDIPLKLAEYPIVFESTDYPISQAGRLLKTPEGRKRLLEDNDLRSLVTSKQANLNIGFYITTVEGREFLAKADDIRAMLGSHFLNYAVGNEKPAAHYLISTEDGRELLRNDNQLFDKLADEFKQALNQPKFNA